MFPHKVNILKSVLFKASNAREICKNGISTKPDDVLFEVLNKKGIITLNKPNKLNSVNMNMITKINDNLIKWKDNVTMVIIKGEGRAFCAGGDVVSLTKKGPKHSKIGKDFFRIEYGLNGLIGSYPIPYVALIDGITMGGGVGLSVHGTVRISTEKTLFAMPETAIGLFPDVGMTYFLSRLPNNLGIFLGLTGTRLNGDDLTRLGIATHFINSNEIKNIFKDLLGLEDPKNDLNIFLKARTEDKSKLKDLSLNPYIKTIEKCFSASKVEEIFTNLEKDGSEFARKTLDTIKTMSPVSLKITFQAINSAKNKNLKESLMIENRIAAGISEARVSADFYEGVRALLIDKDKNPKWNPPTIEKVTDNMINEVFKTLPPNEELKF